MSCQDAIIASILNGLIIGIVVGIILGVIRSLQGERSMIDYIKELIPQAVTIGVVIGFSYSFLASCTNFLSGY